MHRVHGLCWLLCYVDCVIVDLTSLVVVGYYLDFHGKRELSLFIFNFPFL